MAVIELDNVSRAFTVTSRSGMRRTKREVRAVDGMTFTVEPGEVVGYIGPNGAGKSTTIKMLTGILVPSGGSIRVAGVDPSRHRLKLARRIGVVFGQRTTLWWDLPLKDSFAVLQKMYDVPLARHRENLATFVELLDLGDLLDVPVRQLSLGQRMRGDIAAALLHDPEIVYLDEPTIGLDVISKARLREFLAQVNAERRTTIVLTTHDLDDIEALCTRVMVIDHGRQIFDGTLDRLKSSQSAPRTLVVDLATSLPPIEVTGATVVKVDGPRQHITFPTSTSAAPLLAEIAANYPLMDLSVSEPTIESVITQLYTRNPVTSG
ncbi:ATP-binding cassette domain-containing protein [Kribbella sp. NPDC050459]|uniref:ABC transporter ATP-binding protein n=1 Tax=Kribbella sp. NPDC050459 TaxID=3155785 RepID=UPI0033C41F6B